MWAQESALIGACLRDTVNATRTKVRTSELVSTSASRQSFEKYWVISSDVVTAVVAAAVTGWCSYGSRSRSWRACATPTSPSCRPRRAAGSDAPAAVVVIVVITRVSFHSSSLTAHDVLLLLCSLCRCAYCRLPLLAATATASKWLGYISFVRQKSKRFSWYLLFIFYRITHSDCASCYCLVIVLMVREIVCVWYTEVL